MTPEQRITWLENEVEELEKQGSFWQHIAATQARLQARDRYSHTQHAREGCSMSIIDFIRKNPSPAQVEEFIKQEARRRIAEQKEEAEI